MVHTKKVERSTTSISNKGLKIINSLHFKKKLILTLPTHLARKNMHEILTNSIETINNVERSLINNNYENFVIKHITDINATLAGASDSYNYIVAGPSSWNQYYKYYQSIFRLSEYELSALKRINYDLFYFVNNETTKTELINKHKSTYLRLKALIDKFKELKSIRQKIREATERNNAEEIAKINAEKTKFELDNEDNIFIKIEKDIKASMPNSGGIVFYITDIDKNITPKSQHVFHPIKKFEISLVIYKKVNDEIQKKYTSIIKKDKNFFSDVKIAKKTKAPARAKKVQSQPKPTPKKVQSQPKPTPKKVVKSLPPPPPKTQPTRSQPSRKAKQGGSVVRVGQDHNMLFKKTIFSFNVCYDQKHNPQRLNGLISNLSDPLHYLNEDGLYILYEQQIKNLYIYAGEYNTSSIREKIYKKISFDSKSNEQKQTILSRIVWKYYGTFFDSIYYNEKVFKSLLDKFLKTTSIGKTISDLEFEIIEKFRPYINSCIININKELQEITEFNNDIGVFVVGGDSIRRYKNNITQTNDIDSKIHVPRKYQTPDNIHKITGIILKNLFNLCSYFIVFKETIFKNQKNTHEYFYGNINYVLDFTLYNTDPSKDLSNFKFRQIYKDTFPVDLFSLDYKCEGLLNISGDGVNMNIPFDFEIAFIDIVVEMLNDDLSYYKTNAVLSNGLPVSSLEFLIQDLTKTYNSIKSSSLRFLSGKIAKDHVRYDELIYLKSLEPNVRPYNYIKDGSSSIPIIVDNESLPKEKYNKLKEDRQQLDYIIIFPTVHDKDKDTELIDNYNDLIEKFQLYYDSVEIKKSKVLIPYELNSMIKQIEELKQPAKSKPKTKKGGFRTTPKTDYVNQLSSLSFRTYNKPLKVEEEFEEEVEGEEEVKQKSKKDDVEYDKSLKCLVTNNNLIRSYALNVDMNEYDDLFIDFEMELLKNAEYIITDDDIVENDNENTEIISIYKQKFYEKIQKFLDDNGVKAPDFNLNKDFYEIDWVEGDDDDTYSIDIEQLKEYIDSYGGCSFYYEMNRLKKKRS